jgi:tetratricopeptide (TPR) repeat protein
VRAGLNWSLLLDGVKLPGDPIAVLQSDRPEAERTGAVRQLADAAASGHPSALNQYAAGLLVIGRRDEAERVWQSLTRRQPDSVYAQVNLATCHLMAGRIEECARVLEACRSRTEPGTSVRQLVEGRMAELEDAQQDTARHVRMLELRAAAIRERAERGLADTGDLKELARALGALTGVPGSGVTGRDVLDAARRLRLMAPGDPESLEILAFGLLVGDGFSPELSDVLMELEKVAPHSQVLTTVRQSRTDPAFRQRSEARVQRMREVARRAFAGDRDAEAELRLAIQESPANHQYRIDLFHAVYNRGDHAEARRAADELAAMPTADHVVHFHVAQFYWILGAPELSRHHFRRAYETAADETDREDVRLAVRTVGAGPLEELGLD